MHEAAIIGVSELHRYQEAERDLRDLAVVLIRTATDNGERTSLEDVFSRFGFDRATLEREVDEDLATSRERPRPRVLKETNRHLGELVVTPTRIIRNFASPMPRLTTWLRCKRRTAQRSNGR